MDGLFNKRKEDKERSIESEVLKNIDSGIIILEAYKIIYINDWICKKTGYTKEEILSNEIIKYVHPDYKEIVLNYHKRRLEEDSNIPTEYELKILKKNGKILWANAKASTTRVNGDINILFLITDITPLKKIEENFESIFEFSPDAISISRMSDGKIFRINNAFSEITGYTKSEIQKISIFDCISEENKIEILESMNKNIPIKHKRITINHKSGEKIIVSISTKPIDIYNDVCLITIARDVTDIVLHESKIKEALNKNITLYSALATLFDNSAYIIWVRDLERNFLFANKTMKNTFYINDPTKKVKPITNIIENDNKVIQSGKGMTFTEEVLINGEKRVFNSFKVPIFDCENESKIIGTAGMAVEIADISYINERINNFEKHAQEKQNIISDILNSISKINKVDQ